MKKLIPIIALIPLAILAITPPIDISLDCTINSTFWLWMTFASGVMAFLFLYQKVSAWLKAFVVWSFASCFLSKAPYMSFTMYWSLIVCAYYYALCTKIEDWTPVKKTIQAIFLFILLLVGMQISGHDTLLNFGQKIPVIFGTIGNRMISSSLSCVLAPLLILNPINWIPLLILSFISWSSGAILSIMAGLGVLSWRFRRFRIPIVIMAILIPVVFALKTGDIKTLQSKAGRLPVYKKTIGLSLKRPQGYGIGTYKILFPVLCGKEISAQQPGRCWNTAHNDWLQILFETGFIGFILIMGWFVSIIRRVKDPVKLSGMAILATNMIIHFPVRMIQSVLIMIMFLAYCSQGAYE